MRAFHPTILFGFLSLLSLTSCAIYQQEFDCPPPCGVPCTSETDLESRVVETNKGPDLFVSIDKESYCPCRKCKESMRFCSALNRKVWICHHLTEDGCSFQGHYVYQAQDPNYLTTPSCSDPCELEESRIQLMTHLTHNGGYLD